MTFEEYIKYNKAIWQDDDIELNGKSIFFENLSEDFLPLMMDKIITSKGLQHVRGGNIFAIRNKRENWYDELCGSFGIVSKYVYEVLTWGLSLKAFLISCFYVIKNFIYSNVLSYSYKDVYLGDLIYDQLVRTGKRVTIGRIISHKDFINLLKFMMTVEAADKLFRTANLGYFLAGDMICKGGIWCRFARKYGAQIIVVTTGRKTYTYPINDKKVGFYELYRKVLPICIENASSNWEGQINDKLVEMFSGKGDWNVRNAYLNKMVADRNTILDELDINNGKQNVVVMVHCFSDAPHGVGDNLHKDYYEWFVETLKIIRDINNVNWIIKGHPGHYAYGESGMTEKLFEKYKSNNMRWFPEKYSTSTVAKFADVILTIRGTAGMEMACQGIPCVLAGKSYYSDGEYAITPETIEEYNDVLKHLDNVKRLDEQQIKQAKKVFWAYLDMNELVKDDLQAMAWNYYERYLENTKKKEEIQSEYMRSLMKSKTKDDYRRSYWFSWGENNKNEL